MQNKVRNFNDEFKISEEKLNVNDRMLDIQSELGELCKEVLKSSDYGNKKFAVTEDFEMELGDVFYALLSLANEVDVNAELALNKVLEKYKNRLLKNNTIGSGK